MGMFELGKDYSIRMIEEGGENQSLWTVSEIEMPLIKLTSRHQRADRVPNTSSANFISAEEVPYDAEAEQRWRELLD
jgi:hypothetical protein